MFCLSLTTCLFRTGPLLAGVLMSDIGFEWMMRVFAVLSLLFAPLVLVLRRPPVKNAQNESTKLTDGREMQGQEYWSHSDSSNEA